MGVINFTLWSIYPRRHNRRYPLIRMQGGSHGQSGPSNDWQAEHYCMYLTQLYLFVRMGLSTFTLHQTIVIFSTPAGWDGWGMRGVRDAHNCRWKTWRRETSWKTRRLWEVSVKVNLKKRNRRLQTTKLVLLVQDRDQWQVLWTKYLTFGFQYRYVNYWQYEWLLAFKKRSVQWIHIFM
jgi:hypothetical protein